MNGMSANSSNEKSLRQEKPLLGEKGKGAKPGKHDYFNQDQEFIIQEAKDYLQRGWTPIRLKHKSKEPAGKWGPNTITTDNAERLFRTGGPWNLGVLLGTTSGELIDVDLDIQEAAQVADLVWPPGPTFGRKSKPMSHRLIHCTDPQGHESFELKGKLLDSLGRLGFLGDKQMILELRGEKHYTVFPPSIHPCGEEILWEDLGELPEMSWMAAVRRAEITAFLAIVLRAYPRKPGTRDLICMALAGALLRIGFPLIDTDRMVTGVAKLAGDEEWEKRNKAVQTGARLDAFEPVTGLTRLMDLLGLPQEHNALVTWLGPPSAEYLEVPEIGFNAPEDEFLTDRKGKIYPIQHNIQVALNKMEVDLSYDRFADRYLVKGLEGYGPRLDDAAAKELYLRIDKTYKFRPQKEYFWMVLEHRGRATTFHPVLDYLDGLFWDGQSRINEWLIIYGGAPDSEYVRAVGRIVLVAAVRRVRHPGCKFDEMLVLESPQGLGKSTALRTLAVCDEWFTDDLPLHSDAQRIIERVSGRWIVEAAELSGLKRSDVEHLKGFLSRREDRARLAYGRITSEVSRQFIIVGTTNSEQYLKDSTGNRRFWPVKIQEFDLDELRKDRDQLWAEAAFLEAKGESIRLDPCLYPVAEKEQMERRLDDPWDEQLCEYLGDIKGKLRSLDAWHIVAVEIEHRTQNDNQRLGQAMRRLGFTRKQARFGGPNPEWCYVRGDEEKRIYIHVNQWGGITVNHNQSDPKGGIYLDDSHNPF